MALENTRLSVDRIRQHEEKHPRVKQSTSRVARRGVASTAANYVRNLAQTIT